MKVFTEEKEVELSDLREESSHLELQLKVMEEKNRTLMAQLEEAKQVRKFEVWNDFFLFSTTFLPFNF